MMKFWYLNTTTATLPSIKSHSWWWLLKKKFSYKQLGHDFPLPSLSVRGGPHLEWWFIHSYINLLLSCFMDFKNDHNEQLFFLIDFCIKKKKKRMVLQEIQINSNRSNPSKNPKYLSCSPTKLPQATLLIGMLYENQNKSQACTHLLSNCVHFYTVRK